LEGRNIKVGKVKFVTDKGYGFITSDNKDYFFHAKDNKLIDLKELIPGTLVEFILIEDTKGVKASRMIVMENIGAGEC